MRADLDGKVDDRCALSRRGHFVGFGEKYGTYHDISPVDVSDCVDGLHRLRKCGDARETHTGVATLFLVRPYPAGTRCLRETITTRQHVKWLISRVYLLEPCKSLLAARHLLGLTDSIGISR